MKIGIKMVEQWIDEYATTYTYLPTTPPSPTSATPTTPPTTPRSPPKPPPSSITQMSLPHPSNLFNLLMSIQLENIIVYLSRAVQHRMFIISFYFLLLFLILFLFLITIIIVIIIIVLVCLLVEDRVRVGVSSISLGLLHLHSICLFLAIILCHSTFLLRTIGCPSCNSDHHLYKYN